ncbi:MAG TPA: lytic transglycosylase domain-containing protein, partial [Mycobacteriales bacterium]|nr:lytic transglycosylase domain-containing protein [Mycobacteriales bacterium]
MSLLTPFRRARTSAVAALVGAALAIVPVAVPFETLSAAHAAGDPAAQVQQLLAKVHQLQARAHAAELKYKHVFSAVASTVSSALSADQDSSALALQAAQAQTDLDSRVRGLYETGGTLASYAAMLESGSVTEAVDRSVVASRVISAQVADVRAIGKQAALAQAAAARAERRSAAKIHTERNITKVADRIQRLLDEQKALLAKANHRLAEVQAAQAALAAETTSFGTITTDAIANLHILPPSAQYLALYRSAATTCPGLSWTVLAAIGQVESGHGRNPSTSSAGAMGPMQFEPSTFAAYAVDGNNDGVKSIMDPSDAIYTAAHYLCANGAGRSPSALNSAIYHYNHAGWYVAMVLKLASMYAA